MVVSKQKKEVAMKKLFILIPILLIACAGVQIEQTATNNAIAYSAGKAMGIGINKLYPDVDADLSEAWLDLMSTDNDIISSDEMIFFYNRCIGIIGLHTNDPYGLLGDLGALLTIFGAEFTIDETQGAMVFIQPIPKIVLKYFELGYGNGKMVALRG